nr:hypothetical protein [Candidatus Microthrix sp.]
MADVFEVSQERADEWGVKVPDLDAGGLCAGPLGGEREEKPECVSVCRDGVGAGAELAGETLQQRPLQGWGERSWPPPGVEAGGGQFHQLGHRCEIQ